MFDKEIIREHMLNEFHLGNTASKATKNICKALGPAAISKRTCQNWFRRFRAGEISGEDRHRSGRPPLIDEDALKQLIQEYPTSSARVLSKQLNFSKSTVLRHIHEMEKRQDLEDGAKNRVFTKVIDELEEMGQTMSQLKKNPIKMTESPIEIIPCTSAQLNLDVVLLNGQSFRWKKIPTEDNVNTFVGVARQNVWKIWRQNSKQIAFRRLATFETTPFSNQMSNVEILEDYFQVFVLHFKLKFKLKNIDVVQLYDYWESVDSFFKQQLNENAHNLIGIRILKQDLIETIFSFICSANNNIPRISRMVESLCELYGTSSNEIVLNSKRVKFFNFPTLNQLAMGLETMEKQLKLAGFGYRADYVAASVRYLTQDMVNGDEWLQKLRTMDYLKANHQLQKLPGVGPKVADCICLMGLQKHEVVPVDTHIFQLTQHAYPNELQLKKTRNISRLQHDEIGRFYMQKFGSYAGWAHSVLFSARLKPFKNVVDKTVNEEI